MASKWWARFAYVVYVIAFVAVGLEILLRLLPDPTTYWFDQFRFVSPQVFQNQGAGVWTYRPHVDIREAAVYALPTPTAGTRFTVEYDCRMRSNSLGLLQQDDIDPARGTTIVVGDSFTAGQGGCPWFDRLRALRPQEQLLNAGLFGTGIEQWRRLIVHLRERGVNVTRVLAIAISNDFARPAWNWQPGELACLDGGACPPDTHPGVWLPVGSDESREQLIARSAVRLSQRYPDENLGARLWRFFRYYSYVFKFGDHANETMKAWIRGKRCKDCVNTIFSDNESALKGLKELGVPFRVLLVPQRSESGLLWQLPESAAAEAALDWAGVAYDWCPLPADDYLPIDGHPNKAGYDKLVACVNDRLNRMEPARAGVTAR